MSFKNHNPKTPGLGWEGRKVPRGVRTGSFLANAFLYVPTCLYSQVWITSLRVLLVNSSWPQGLRKKQLLIPEGIKLSFVSGGKCNADSSRILQRLWFYDTKIGHPALSTLSSKMLPVICGCSAALTSCSPWDGPDELNQPSGFHGFYLFHLCFLISLCPQPQLAYLSNQAPLL